MAAPLLALKDLSLALADRTLFRGLDLSLESGDRLALVGRNGSGKSTLLKVIAGMLQPDAGQITFLGGTRSAYLPQEPDFGSARTALDHVAGGLTGEDPETRRYRAEAMLLEVGIPPDRTTHGLSGGEARKLDLARLLVSDAEIWLMDEPTNHLDLPAITWLESIAARHRGGLIVISHDRRFLDTVSNATLWLDRGIIRRMNQPFRAFEGWAEMLLEEEATVRHKMDRLIEEETRWSREGISARRKRNQGRLRRLGDLRQDRSEQIKLGRLGALAMQSGALSGKIVVEATHIAKAFNGRTIIQPFSTIIQRGDRVGLIGPNGAGKTTLLKMLTGQMKPDSGSVKLGANLTLALFDQARAQLDQSLTVQQVLCPEGSDFIEVQGKPRHITGYLKEFLFDPRATRTPVAALSGGEKNRLWLAKTLAQPANFLVLDEPTNDLDMETLDLLQEALAEFQGTALIVSHDRDFLDRVVTATIAVEPGGVVTEYAGGYTDALQQMRKPGAPAAAPATRQTAQGPSSGSATSPVPGSATKARSKLSFKQARALELLPQELDALQQKLRAAEQALADPTLYGRDPQRFARLGQEIADLRSAIDAKETEWLDLSLLAESLAQGG